MLKSKPILPLSIVFFAFLFFFPYDSNFIWDDELLVLQNGNTSSFDALKRMWLEDLWARVPGEHAHHWFRPLMTLSLWIDHTVFGQNATLALLHSSIYALIANFLLWKILRNWGVEHFTACLGLVFFTLHPIQLEALRFVAARNDLMSMAALLALVHQLQLIKPKKILLVTYASIALFSKESSLIFIPLLVFAHSLWASKPPQWKTLATLGIPIGVWLLLRHFAITAFPPVSLVAILKTPIIAGCLIAPTTCPAAAPPQALGHVAPIAFLAAVLFVGSLVKNRRLGVTGLLIGGVGLILAAQASVLSSGMAHRYLLWPLIGLTIAICGLLNTKTKVWMIPFLGLAMAFTTHLQKKHWDSTITVWTHAHDLAPSQQSACALFKQYEQINEDDKALTHLLEALESPPKIHCCFNASRFPFERGQLLKTIEIGYGAIKQGCPRSPELLAPLAMAEAIQGNWQQAAQLAGVNGTDPWGFGPVILTAEGLRRGDNTELSKWTAQAGLSDSGPLREKAMLLIQKSEDNAAE